MTLAQDNKLTRLEQDIGEVLERSRTGGPAASDYTRFAADPVGFITSVTKAKPWAKEVEIAEAVRTHPLVTVRSCNAAGKDWLAARLALWWVYARRGLVVLTAPTASQVEEILMRKELRSASRAISRARCTPAHCAPVARAQPASSPAQDRTCIA